MYEPVLLEAAPFVDATLIYLIVPRGRRRQHLDHEVGRAAHTALADLALIADHQHVGLYHGIDVFVGLIGLGQADVHGQDKHPARFSLQGVLDLPEVLPGDVLMVDRRCGCHEIGDAIDQLIAHVLRPAQIVGVAVSVVILER